MIASLAPAFEVGILRMVLVVTTGVEVAGLLDVISTVMEKLYGSL